MTDTSIIVAVTADDHDAHHPDSTIGNCNKCKAGVLLAPSSLDILRNAKNPSVLCMNCAVELGILENPNLLQPLTEMQAEEIRKLGFEPDIAYEMGVENLRRKHGREGV